MINSTSLIIFLFHLLIPDFIKITHLPSIPPVPTLMYNMADESWCSQLWLNFFKKVVIQLYVMYKRVVLLRFPAIVKSYVIIVIESTFANFCPIQLKKWITINIKRFKLCFVKDIYI